MRSLILTMSLSGTMALLCCFLFLRLFGRSLKAKWRRALLLLALSFYLLPLPNYKFILLQGGQALHIIPDTRIVSLGNLSQAEHYRVYIDEDGGYSYSDEQTMLNIISSLLLTVSALLMLYHIAGYIRVRKTVRISSQPADEEQTAMLEELKVCMGIHRRIHLAQSELVSVPMVSGIFTPTILFPNGRCADNRALKSMLLHELAHIKHQDILFQWVCLLAAALHWFNPFGRLLLHMLTEANEQFSDAETVQRFSEQGKIRYCETLIQYSEQTTMGEKSLVVLGFNKNVKKQIKGRIDEVLNKKTKRPGIALLTGVLVMLLGTAAGFVYRPPLTVEGSLPVELEEKVLDKDVDMYFVPSLIPEEQKE